jgi:hypothetical protein
MWLRFIRIGFFQIRIITLFYWLHGRSLQIPLLCERRESVTLGFHCLPSLLYELFTFYDVRWHICWASGVSYPFAGMLWHCITNVISFVCDEITMLLLHLFVLTMRINYFDCFFRFFYVLLLLLIQLRQFLLLCLYLFTVLNHKFFNLSLDFIYFIVGEFQLFFHFIGYDIGVVAFNVVFEVNFVLFFT